VLRSKKPPRVLHPLTFFLIFLSSFFFIAKQFSGPSPQVSHDLVADKAGYADIAVIYVYDGDTIKLADAEKVRFVGIDTPESSRNKKLFRDASRSGEDINKILAMGRSAKEYTKGLLEGRRVRLEFDIEKRDKYGRLLAYVYRVDDGLFVNEDIIRNGYAYPMTIPPNVRHADEFKKLFREAQKAERGLWSSGPRL
jgi:micrococcal nuclease